MLRFFYQLYQLTIFAPLFLLVSFIVLTVTGIGSMIGLSRWFAFYPNKFWGWFAFRMLFLPVEVEGKEKLGKNESYIFVANHQSAFDIFLLPAFLGREFKWMLKESLRKAPLLGFACEKAGMVFADNSSIEARHRTLETARKHLENGTSLMIFAEGTRTFTGKMNSFKSGAFRLADSLQLPVVPVTLDGCFEVYSRSKFLGFVEWHPLRLVIHSPIYPETKGVDNVKRLRMLSYAAVESALPPQHRNSPKL